MAIETAQYITYQHNVQRFFREHAEKYIGVVIPLSIATSFPTGTYGFVRALCTRNRDKRYSIDPRTPLFQKQWNREYVRPPHRRMAKVLGGAFDEFGLSRALDPSDFSGPKSPDAVTEKCLQYQLGFRARDEDVRKLRKYRELLAVPDLDELGEPQFLFPPYFQFDSHGDGWYQVALACMRAAGPARDTVPVRPVVHFRSWCGVGDWQGVLDDLAGLGASDFWLYPNLFKEHEQKDAAELRAYKHTVTAAVSKGLRPFALFGGYFSILMSYVGLRGFSNGVGYGEWRDSGYHRGGTAVNRIYIPKLHRYLDPPGAQDLIERDPDYFAGDSGLLRDCLDADRPLGSVVQAECLDHFMECRHQEILYCSGHSLEDAASELETTCDHLSEVGQLQSEKYGASLALWREVVQG